ncbi:glycosyltransferase [Nocardioides sp. zg-1308]|uniref:Glycosyltransferase n=1 Tax=Nocardioides renjunii TaxID=3095075 RepID=A0ABU5K8D3_9ACTN|nr:MULTISPECIES: glycosyltransferase [unclassified Nocardioides]MDZ5661157.1 glycosyltransferase [Nocardioides sp. S-58]NPD04274.1 glycosyltransferase [Nocardioides sp. zg-1308]
MTEPSTTRRSSPGGYAVSDSLAAAGFVADPRIALVETARPGRTPYDAVVCQNAWNFLPRDHYARLVTEYAPRRRALYLARRRVAAHNTRRARTNVVLSTYMRDLLAARGRRTTLAEVTLPWDLCTADDVASAGAGSLRAAASSATGLPPVHRPFVLVPGTLTWYKSPGYALDLLARIPAAERPLLVLAGTDDGSGCAQDTRSRAAAAGIEAWIGPAERPTMKWLLAHAQLTLVPSRLESLSFSMAEALLLSPRVAALPIPVHGEMVERLGRRPVWLTDDPAAVDLDELLAPLEPVDPVDVAPFRAQWFELAGVLNEAGRA